MFSPINKAADLRRDMVFELVWKYDRLTTIEDYAIF